MKTFSCKDVGMSGCNYQVSGDSDDEIVRKAADHGMRVHKQAMTPEIEKKVRDHIKNM